MKDLHPYRLLCVFVCVCVCVYPTHSYCCVARLPIFHIIYTAETVTNHEELVVLVLYILVFFVSMVTWLFSGLCSSHLWQWWSSPAHICLSACFWMPAWYSGIGTPLASQLPRNSHWLFLSYFSAVVSSQWRGYTSLPHSLFSLSWAISAVYNRQSNKLGLVSWTGLFILFVNTIELLGLTVYSCPIWNSLCRLGCLIDFNNSLAFTSECWDYRVCYHAWLYLDIHKTMNEPILKFLRKKSVRRSKLQASHKPSQGGKKAYSLKTTEERSWKNISCPWISRIKTVKMRISLKRTYKLSAVPIRIHFSQP